MSRRAFIIHGYLSYPQEAWLPWLRDELARRGFDVSLPAMPNPDRPTIPQWIGFIAGLVGEPDANTVLVGHSLGCQAVVRYLETVGGAGGSVGRTVLVAGGFPAALAPAEALRRADGAECLIPWFTTPVDGGKVKRAAGKCTVILSDDDPYIPVEKAKAAYAAQLGATIVIETGKGHFNEDDHLTELPSALEAVIA